MSVEHGADTRQYGNLSYSYPVAKLWSGASFGSRACFARTDRLTNLDGFWLAANNQWLCGKFDLRIEADGQPVAAASTSFYPGHQQTTFSAPGLSAGAPWRGRCAPARPAAGSRTAWSHSR